MSDQAHFEGINDPNFERIVDEIYSHIDTNSANYVPTQQLCQFVIKHLQDDRHKIDRLKVCFHEYNDQNIDKKTFEFLMKQWLADIRGISNEEEIIGDVVTEVEGIDQEELMTKIHELEFEKVTLKKKLREIQSSSLEEYNQLKNELEFCEKQKLAIERKYNDLLIKLKKEKVTSQSQEKWNADLVKKLEELKKHQESTRTELDELKVSNDTLVKENALLEKDLKTVSKDKNNQKHEISVLKAENLRIVDVNKDLETVLERLTFEIDNLKRKLISEIREKNAYEVEVNELRNKYDELVKTRENMIEFMINKISSNNANQNSIENDLTQNFMCKTSEFLENMIHCQNNEYSGSSSISNNKTLWNTFVDFINSQSGHNGSVVSLDAEIKYMKLHAIHQHCEETIKALTHENEQFEDQIRTLREHLSSTEKKLEMNAIRNEKLNSVFESNKSVLKSELDRIRKENHDLSLKHTCERDHLKLILRTAKHQLNIRDCEIDKLTQNYQLLLHEYEDVSNFKNNSTNTSENQIVPFWDNENRDRFQFVEDPQCSNNNGRYTFVAYLVPMLLICYLIYIYVSLRETCRYNSFSLIRWIKYLFSFVYRKDVNDCF